MLSRSARIDEFFVCQYEHKPDKTLFYHFSLTNSIVSYLTINRKTMHLFLFSRKKKFYVRKAVQKYMIQADMSLDEMNVIAVRTIKIEKCPGNYCLSFASL